MPFRLPRKRQAAERGLEGKNLDKASRRVIKSITVGPPVPTACIAVDSPNRTYLCGRQMIPTHNTGKIKDYNILKVLMQLAVYSRSRDYDRETGERTTHGADTNWGLVLHTPSGSGRAQGLWVDLTKGWQAVMLCRAVREMRTLKVKETTHAFAPPPGQIAAQRDAAFLAALAPHAHIVAVLDAATTVTELYGAYATYESSWAPALSTYAERRKAAIDREAKRGAKA